MQNQNSALHSFAKMTKSEWEKLAMKEIKQDDLSALESKTRDGLTRKPYYNREDLEEIAPFVLPKANVGWHITDEIEALDEDLGNAQALKALQREASSLLFYVTDNVNFHKLLNGVLIEHIETHWVVEGSIEKFLRGFSDYIAENDLNTDQIRGSVNIDPIENLLRTGNWAADEETDFKNLAHLVAHAPKNMRTLAVNANLYQNAGATSMQQLAFSLAHMHEYILRHENSAPQNLNVVLAVGGNFFEEIAKLRAMRMLHVQLLKSYNLPYAPLQILAETSLRNKSIYDEHTNLLRTTTEAMSAVIGGCDGLMVKPFSAAMNTQSNFAWRMAINQQLILAKEAYLDKVLDPAAGSYFVESLSRDMANAAWALFRKLESKGGFLKLAKSGEIQDIIEESHLWEQAMFDENKLELLGANLYLNKEERKADTAAAPFPKREKTNTTVRPIVAKRLAQKLEVERMKNEKTH